MKRGVTDDDDDDMAIVKVTFKKAGGPRHDVTSIWAYRDRVISLEELESRRPPPPYKPFDMMCRVLRKGEDFLDVETLYPITLSVSNGITREWTFYRLRKTRDVAWFREKQQVFETSYQYEQRMVKHIKEGTVTLLDWTHDVPTWSIDSRNTILPIIYLLLLANCHDKDSAFGSLPRDVAVLLAKAVLDTRRDPSWIFGEKVHAKRKRRKV